MTDHVSVTLQGELGAHEVQVVRLPPDVDGRPREALVLRDAAGTLRAYLNRCQHLPIPLDGGSRQFLARDAPELECRTHGARYRIGDGRCVRGPCAGRSLVALEVERVGNVLRIALP